MGNAFITKGALVTLGSGSIELKAVVIEDFDIAVGLNSVERTTASDGTSYSFTGEQEESKVDISLLSTDDVWDDILTAIYGNPSVSGSRQTWNMKNAGGSNTVLAITSPQTTGTYELSYRAVNPKGLGIVPRFVLNKGFEGTMSIVCDYWEAIRDRRV